MKFGLIAKVLLWNCVLITAYCLKAQRTTRNVSYDVGGSSNLLNFHFTRRRDLDHESLNISKQCREDLVFFSDSLTAVDKFSGKPTWADYMLDSYGGVPSGITAGHHYWLGDFEECIRIEVRRTTTDRSSAGDPDINGQYCLAFLSSITTPYHSIQIGTCSPSSCSSDDLQTIYGQDVVFPFTLVVDQAFCQTRFKQKMDSISVGICAMIGILVSVVVAASVYEVVTCNLKSCGRQCNTNDADRLPSKLKQYFLAFSGKTNLSQIFSTEDEKSLPVLHGLRAISMSWVVTGHTLIIMTSNLYWKNQTMFVKLMHNYSMQMLTSAEYAVDTFLFLSGFLSAYGLLSKLQRNSNFNYPMQVLHRICRILPAYLFVLAVMSGPIGYAGKGPISPGLLVDREVCRRRWWQHALFIHVYFDDEHECLPQTWYLCLDMTYYLLYPLIVYTVHKKPLLGYVTFGLFFIASFAIPGVLIYMGNLQPLPFLIGPTEYRKNFVKQIYDKPWGRMSAYLIGLAFGYVAYRKPPALLNMRLIFVYPLWALSATMGLALAYGTHPYVIGKPMDLCLKVAFGIFSRPMWCIVIGWIVLACTNGYGSTVNSILSWKGFIPISKLSYCTYLVHFTVIALYFGNIKDTIYIDLTMMVYIVMLIFVLSSLSAICVNLLVEEPFLRLEKLILPK